MFLQLATITRGPDPGPNQGPKLQMLCVFVHSAVRPSGIVNIRYICHWPPAFGFNLLSGPCSGLDQPYSLLSVSQPGLPKISQVSPKSARIHQNQPGISTKSSKTEHGGKQLWGGGARGEKNCAIKSKRDGKQHSYFVEKKENTYFLKNGSEHVFRRKHRGANQALEKVPGHPTKKKQHNFASFGLSRRQNKPLASTKTTHMSGRLMCLSKYDPLLPLSLIEESRTTDYILPRLRLSRLKIQKT